MTIAPAPSSTAVIAGQLAGKYDVTDGAYVSSTVADALQHANLRVLAPAANMAPLTQEVMVPAGSPQTPNLGKSIDFLAISNLSYPWLRVNKSGGFVMVRRFSRLPITGVIAVAAVLAAACASGGGSSTPAGVEKPDLTVATIPTLDNAGLYVAEQRGLFAAEGLHVTLKSATSGSVMFAAQEAGKYDVTVGAYVSSMLADALHHADLRIIAPASAVAPLSQEVVVGPGSPVQTVSELAGKKIALNGLTGIGIVMVSALLADSGVPLNSVHFVVIPYPKMAAALAAHKVDAVQIPEPYLTGAEESVGAVAIADVDQGPAQSLPVSGYTVTQSWLDKYPRTAAAFRRAVLKAQAIANTNLAAVQDAIATYGDTTLATARLAAPPAFPLQTNARLLQRVANLLEQFGLTQQVFNASSMIRG